MRTQKELFSVIFLVSAALAVQHLTAPPVSFAGEQEDIVLVGRISHVEGELSRYIPEEEEWVETVRDAPFGLHDALYAGAGARAEFIMPNNTWVRIGEDTHIQMVLLTEDLTEVDVPVGVARFHNRSSRGVIRAATPFGEAWGGPGTIFDLYVGEQSAEILALKGRVDFFHERDGVRHQVTEEQGSIIADSSRVTSGTPTLAGNWDQWNKERDRHWTRRVEVQGDSARYLPEGLRYDARDLDDHGRWERVYHDGGYHHLWRPTRVYAGWSPYTEGRWISYYGDQCWIPYEPFGYVTHHYGSWIHVGSFWYWAPPVPRTRVRVVSPLSITFSWYPGRVGWIHRDSYVGWVVLAPWEVYHSHRYWGPRTVVINRVNIVKSSIPVHRYRHLDRAVIIHHRDLYGRKHRSYRGARVTSVNRSTLAREYRGAHRPDKKVIPDQRSHRNRHRVTDRTIHPKPRWNVEERVVRNRNSVRDRSRSYSAPFSRVEGRSATGIQIHRRESRQGFSSPRATGRSAGMERERRSFDGERPLSQPRERKMGPGSGERAPVGRIQRGSQPPSPQRFEERARRTVQNQDPGSFRSSRRSGTLQRETPSPVRAGQGTHIRSSRTARDGERFQTRQRRTWNKTTESRENRSLRNNPLRSPTYGQHAITRGSQPLAHPGTSVGRAEQRSRPRSPEHNLGTERSRPQRNVSPLRHAREERATSRDQRGGSGERLENRSSRGLMERMGDPRLNPRREIGGSRSRGHESRQRPGRASRQAPASR